MMIGAALYAYRFCKTEDASILIIATFVSIYLIGVHYSVARFDIVVMLLIFMSWRASLNDRWKDSGFFLILASALKLTPIVLLPLLYILAPKNAQKRFCRIVLITARLNSIARATSDSWLRISTMSADSAAT